MTTTELKATHLIGLKVIAMDTGKQIDTVSDVIYDPESNSLEAILIDEGGWFSDAKIVRMQDIHSIGHDAIIIESEEKVTKAGKVSDRLSNIAKDKTYLTQTKIISQQGDDLGKVTDLYFDPKSGRATKIEVSEGIIGNIGSGKKIVNVSDIITIGQDATIVSAWVASDIEEQKQTHGIQGAINSAKDRTQELVEKAKPKVEQAVHTVQEKASQAGEQVKTKAEEAQVKASLAKMEARDKAQNIQNQANVVKGNVGNSTSQTSQNAGQKLDDLKQDFQSGDLQNKAKDLAGNASDTIQSAASKVANLAKDTFNNTKQAVTDKREEMAVGNYATVNVLDQNDKLIIAKGQMIKHETVEAARSAGVLDKLLNNVSKSSQAA